MFRIVPALAVLLLAGCYPEVPMEAGKVGDGTGDTGGDGDLDADGDGIPASEDCDDTNASIRPGADELCDGVDNDCDGVVDPDDSVDAVAWFVDTDGDGFGDGDASGQACVPPEGTAAAAGDCDDSNGDIHPDADEVCDSVDNDCDTLIDGEDDSIDPSALSRFYADTDDDGFGDPDASVDACEAPPGHVAESSDCDDLSGAVHPAATEVCDDIDNDCDGLIDGDDDSVDPSSYRDFYADNDADGYGSGDIVERACATPEHRSTRDDDCNDSDSAVHPAATEVCDALDVDEDCDDLVDDADPSVDASTTIAWTPDSDVDGYGDIRATATMACDDPSTESDVYVLDATDCDDAVFGVNPGATEVCDADDTDEDCDGLSDDDDSSTDPDSMSDWAVDGDGDGFGDSSTTAITACEDPSTGTTVYVADTTDCDDAEFGINPGAQEVCDALDVDEDCDGLSDDADPSVDASTATTWYADGDGDGYGDASSTGTPLCEDPASGYEATADDCDDSDPAVNPGATEICSYADDDCDASTSQAGMARFEDSGGSSTDLSSSLSSGNSSTAASWSSSGDGTLWICEDTWYVLLDVSGDTVDIIGPDGSSATVLDGAWDSSVVDISSHAQVTMEGFTVTGGWSWDGAGIVVDTSEFSGEDLYVTYNEAWDGGGGLASFDSALTLSDVEFYDNYADKGGAVYIDGDDGALGVSIGSSTLTYNYSWDKGAGVYLKGQADVAITRSVISNNQADDHGGGLYQSDGELTIDTSTFDSNSSDKDGGGIYLRDTTDITASSFDNNKSYDDGGGLYIDLHRSEAVTFAGTIGLGTTASTSSVSGNSASDDGDGIFIKISDDSPTGSLDVDTVDFGSDAVYYDTDNNGTLSPGNGSSFYCDHDDDCR